MALIFEQKTAYQVHGGLRTLRFPRGNLPALSVASAIKTMSILFIRLHIVE